MVRDLLVTPQDYARAEDGKRNFMNQQADGGGCDGKRPAGHNTGLWRSLWWQMAYYRNSRPIDSPRVIRAPVLTLAKMEEHGT